MKNIIVALLLSIVSSLAQAVAPQKLILTNQFGEQSVNIVNGTYLPLPGPKNNVIIALGTVTPTSVTLVGVAGTGSLYINRNPAQNGSAKLFINFGTITAPAWGNVGP